MHVAAIFRLLSNLSVIEVEILKLEAQLINGYDMLPGVILKSACQESLREEETTDPETLRSAISNPILQEVYPSVEVFSPTCKRLHRKETLLVPYLRHLVVEERVCQQLELVTHDDLTLKSLFNVYQILLHHLQQSIVSNYLLHQNCIH